MKTVAIIGTRGYPSYYGGFETAVRVLAPYLADHGWEVTVFGRPNFVEDADTSRDPRVRSVLTAGLETRSLSTLTYGLSATLKAIRMRPNVVLVMNVANGFWLPLLRIAGIPTLVNVDGMEWEREKWGRLARKVFRWGAHLSARFGTELVVDAQEIGKRWRETFGRSGIFIPYGGTPVDTTPVPENLTHRGYVLSIARFVPENSVTEFFASVPDIARVLDVVIVGSSGYGGAFDEAARDLALQHSNVYWLGHVSDDDFLLSLWNHAAVYFHGHSVGGTNPALVQAMAAGAPTVARDTPFNREVLGPVGRYCQPEPSAIVSAVLAVAQDPDAQVALAADGRRRARDIYSWASVCAKYEAELAALPTRAKS